MNLINQFGQKFFGKDTQNKTVEITPSPIPPTNDEAAFVIGTDYFGRSIHNFSIDSANFVDENELIKKYRDVALMPEVDKAISEIVNQAITGTDSTSIVDLNLDAIDIPDTIKDKIRDEFKTILSLLDFNSNAYEIFKKWYVDGRQYYHIIIDENNKKSGIKELRYVSPLSIKKIREEIKEIQKGNIEVVTGYQDYYIYTSQELNYRNQTIKIFPESIAYNNSGLVEDNTNKVFSYLHKAILPSNKLRMLESAIIIYRLSRAPERRVFYVDVGNLPKAKAEQYLKSVITKYKNKMVYDSNTGQVKDQTNTLSMMEDIWLPRREGGKSTEVSTLEGGQNLGEIQDIQYFQKKLYEALNVPLGRIVTDQSAGFSLGRSAEISREEVSFGKFIARLRKKFSNLFIKLLRTQLLLKNILSDSEWQKIKQEISFTWEEDTYFNELKEAEILKDRINLANDLLPFVGKIFSQEFIKKKVFKLSDDEIDEMKKQIEEEIKSGEIIDPASLDSQEEQ